ncbi:MAG TPA: anti-sigma factor, partial [Actinoplanes sp.]
RERAGVVLVAAGTAPASDRTLQLWTLRGSTPTSAGLVGAGVGSTERIIEGLPGQDGFAVSLEPAPNGSVTPSNVLGSVRLT